MLWVFLLSLVWVKLFSIVWVIQFTVYILPRSRLQECYSLFEDRFGPERLRNLHGEDLLNTMHLHGRDSLVYWLEFKDDDELPTGFGSIAGGSAHKFGLFRRKDSGVWIGGSPQNQVELSIDEAIEIARKHRDQLIEGTRILKDMPSRSSDIDYLKVQEQMDNRASDVSGTAWGHKYFSLLFPEKLDDYHSEIYQRFYLIKLLQTPSENDGRYVCAGKYVSIASELEVPINSLTRTLNQLIGRPYRIWRIGTRLSEKDSIWEMMNTGNVVSIGWDKLGDLSDIKHDQISKDKIRDMLKNLYYPSNASLASRKATEAFNFVATISENDVVVAAQLRSTNRK